MGLDTVELVMGFEAALGMESGSNSSSGTRCGTLPPSGDFSLDDEFVRDLRLD